MLHTWQADRRVALLWWCIVKHHYSDNIVSVFVIEKNVMSIFTVVHTDIDWEVRVDTKWRRMSAIGGWDVFSGIGLYDTSVPESCVTWVGGARGKVCTGITYKSHFTLNITILSLITDLWFIVSIWFLWLFHLALSNAILSNSWSYTTKPCTSFKLAWV